MSLSLEITERIIAVEANLAKLDPTFDDFCTKHGYALNKYIGVWPRRKLWARNGIDRTIDLTMDLTVPEIIELGFFP